MEMTFVGELRASNIFFKSLTFSQGRGKKNHRPVRAERETEADTRTEGVPKKTPLREMRQVFIWGA